VVALRAQLTADGLDAGPETIRWHLEREGLRAPSTSTIRRILHAAGLITPQPRKRPRSSYTRFEMAQPNELWQSDFIHWRLADGTEVEILNWLDDHSRYLLSSSVDEPVTGDDVVAVFPGLIEQYGPPAATLTDNGTSEAGGVDTDPGQDRAFPPDPAALAEISAAGAHAQRAAGPARRVPRPLQRAPPASACSRSPTTTGSRSPSSPLARSSRSTGSSPNKTFWRNQNKEPGRWPGSGE